MKIKHFIIYILFLIIPLNVNAAYARLRTENQSPIINTEVEIFLEGTFDISDEIGVSEVHYKITYNPEYLTFQKNDWSQSSASIDYSTPGVILIDKTSSNKYWYGGNIAMLTFTVNKTNKTSITLEETGTSYYSNGEKINQTTSPITISAKEPNSVTNIGGLSVKGYTFNPTFSRTRYKYTLHVASNVEQVEVIATKANSTQTITANTTTKSNDGNYLYDLRYGDNKVRVIVTAQNGDSTTYEIMITREDNRSNSVGLKKLSITNTDISYVEGQYEYSTTVSKSVDNIFISATPSDEYGTIEGLGSKTLQEGLNTFQITVTSSNGSSQIYTFNITKLNIEYQIDSKGTELKSLKIGDKDITIIPNQKYYLYTTSDKITEIPIEVQTKSNTAKYKINGNTKLSPGPNTITITVTEENEQETYYIYLYRYPSGIRELSDISFNVDQNNNDVLWKTTKQDSYTIPESFIKSMTKNQFSLYIAIIDDNDNLDTLIKIPSSSIQETIEFNKTDDVILTYKTNFAEGIEITKFMGDLYPNDSILKVYSSQEGFNYRELSGGTQLIGGYLTFTTDLNNKFTITDKTLVEHQKTIKDYYEEYKLYIGIAGCVIFLLVFLGIIKKFKKKKVK